MIERREKKEKVEIKEGGREVETEEEERKEEIESIGF